MVAAPRTADRAVLLRLALRLDALASGALGALSLAAAPTLDPLLGVPTGLLWPVGGALLVWAAAPWLAASRPVVGRPIAWSVIALNALWVAASVLAVAAGWLPLTAPGAVFAIAQAVAVAALAEVQLLGLRRD